jgi:2-amino-4-hydroxy-6-hydroxymethyldihydropteridine diphosphokinase
MTIACIGIGSNLDDRFSNLYNSIGLLVQECHIMCISSVYETEPDGYKDQPEFLNCVAKINTELQPHQLLQELKGIEGIMGRTPSFLNGPRLIDLDILLYGNCIMQTAELTLPHPRLHERAFVLVPLCEIEPDLVHPVLHKTIKELLIELKNGAAVKKWGKINTGSPECI